MSEDRGVPDTPIRKKVALVGYTSSRVDAPWGNPDWDVLGCNNLHIQIPDLWPQATGWFNLHRWVDIACDEPHIEWLKTVPFPVFLFPEAIEAAKADGHEFPTVVPFPHRELVEGFNGSLKGYRYITNSISWMIALTIARFIEAGITDGEIGLWGIDLAQGQEYEVERPSVEYWLGVAEGAGLTVTIAPTADILKCAGLYGVDEGLSDMLVKLLAREGELTQQLGERAEQHERLRSEMEVNRYHEFTLRGALENTQYIRRNWLQQAGNVRQGGEDPYSTQAAESEPEVA